MTARELAAIAPHLAGAELPKALSTLYEMIEREAWPFRERSGRGGGREYPITTLPERLRTIILTAVARGEPAVCAALGVAPVPAAAPALPVPAAARLPAAPIDALTPAAKTGLPTARCGRKTLTLRAPMDWAAPTEAQRRVRDARAAILAEVDRLAALGSVTAAIDQLVAAAAAGRLRPELQALVAVANARSGARGRGAGLAEGRTITRRTIFGWRQLMAEGGVQALTPADGADVADTKIPDWAPFLLATFQQPQQPALAEVLSTLAVPDGIAKPSYDQARRFLARLAPFSAKRGRLGPNALKAYRAYVARSTDDLWPTAVYISDGHTFKAKVLHPLHGQPFQPEITPVIDVKTRAVVGWSAGIVENSIGVLEALSSAMAPQPGQPGGVPAIFYSDLGKGFKNEILSTAATGFYARWGIREEHSRARNSQARGIVERFHQTLHALAKSLPTYCGDDMDKDATREIAKANRVAGKAQAPLPFVVTWPEFLDAIKARIERYNRDPHSGLPKVRDLETGQTRHQSPLEAWAAGVVAGGYQPLVVTGDDVADLMRPYVTRKARRGLVELFGATYFDRRLEAFDGDAVQVGFDIADAGKVWVRDTEGRLLAVAAFDGNKQPYFSGETVAQARTFTERTMAARTKGRLARNEANRQEILAEARPQLTLAAANPAPQPLSDAQRAAGDRLYLAFSKEVEAPIGASERADDTKPITITGRRPGLESLTTPPPAPVIEVPAAASWQSGRPTSFADDVSMARWLAANPDAATADDVTWLRKSLQRGPFRRLLEFEGVDLGTLRTIAC